jgi:hypothetical protein
MMGEQVYAVGMEALAELVELVDRVEVPLDGDALRQALWAQDRLAAKISQAIGEFDAAGLWDLDAAHSMTSWLRHHAGMCGPDAQRTASTAKRLRTCPATRDAWVDGALSGGQVRAVTANVTDRTAGLYADHEAALVPRLAPLDVPDTARAMRDWATRADAVLGPDREPAEPARSLHLSPTLAGRRELRGSFDPEAGEVIAAALRLAHTPDPDGHPARSPAQRRGDALVDLCRWFLDHQSGHRAGRHRPHLNVLCTLDDLAQRGQGRLLDGTPLDPATLRRLACDAGIHRVITDGRSTILDYGRTTRTISPELWAALVIRDGGCRGPWCDRGPDWCEAHHIWHWEDGGPTQLDNLALYCTRDHHRFHAQGWHIKLHPDGTIEHTAPNGQIHTSHPPPRE